MSDKKQAVAVASRAGAESHPVAMPKSAAIANDAPPKQWGMIFVLARIFYAMRSRCDEALQPHGLTPMQFTIISTLNAYSGMSSAELSRRFNVTPQTMGEMIVNLERRAVVERRQDPTNRRALKLSLTDEGRRLLEVGNKAMNKVETEMFSALPPAAREDLRTRLRELHDQFWQPGT
jgi:DNA-binding MarR family transcriptional regulator